MIEVVFISDLHLHPQMADIQVRFDRFLKWVKRHSIKKIYILGDFFHAWAGDDSIDDWSKTIAGELNKLVQQGTELFYMHGNRDFLLGQKFAMLAGWTILSEPTVISLGNGKVLLVHGDRYCIKDKSHQWFRRLTRNKWFAKLFLMLPLNYRKGLVNKVRQISQESYKKPWSKWMLLRRQLLAICKSTMFILLIHGHTHKPGLVTYSQNKELKRYVLSDWDDTPLLLCYDYSRVFILLIMIREVDYGRWYR